MAYGAQAAQVLYVAARLALADLLATGPGDSCELAIKANLDERVLRRLLRGLVSLGVCSEVGFGRFALTEIGEYLRSDHPQSLQARILFNGEVLWPIWGELLGTVRSGSSGAVRAFGMPFCECGIAP